MRHKKTVFWVSEQVRHRRRLDYVNYRFKESKHHTMRVAKTKILISAFIFVYARSSVSYDTDQQLIGCMVVTHLHKAVFACNGSNDFVLGFKSVAGFC